MLHTFFYIGKQRAKGLPILPLALQWLNMVANILKQSEKNVHMAQKN